VTITAVGGSGGSDVADGIVGGEGGIVTQNASATPGESLTVTVGANGQCAPDGGGCDGPGGSGYGSGGNSTPGSGGGGGSAVVDNGTVIVVAGGGGGAAVGASGGNADQSGAGDGGAPGTLSGPGGGACITLPEYFCAEPGVGMNGGSAGGGGAGGGGFFGGGAGTIGGGIFQASGGGGGGASYPAPATRWDTTATPSVTINPDATTAVLVPSNGASLSGTGVTLDASASNATSVEYLLFGGVYGYAAPVICTTTLTYYGWACSWNTTTVPDGSYALVSEASGPGGSAYSSGVSITIDN
jgi:hypothetical protein